MTILITMKNHLYQINVFATSRISSVEIVVTELKILNEYLNIIILIGTGVLIGIKIYQSFKGKKLKD